MDYSYGLSGNMSIKKDDKAQFWGTSKAKLLKDSIKIKFGTVDAFLKATGFGRQTTYDLISAQKAGKAKSPTPKTILKFCDALEIDPAPFLAVETGAANSPLFAAYEKIDPAEYVLVPYLGGTLSAGDGAYLSNEAGALEGLPFPRDRLKARARDIKQVHLLSVKGESMSPTVRDGDLVLIDLSNREPKDGIFALQHTDTLYLKRLRFLNGGTNVLIESDNPVARGNDLGVVPLNDVDFTLIGRAIYTITEPGTL